MRLNRKQKSILSGTVLLLILLLNFQNCGQIGSISVSSKSDAVDTRSPSSTDTDPNPGGSGGGGGYGAARPTIQSLSSDTFVSTELNTPIEFNLVQVTSEILTGVKISDTSFSALQGTLSLVNEATFKFNYTPHVGFRGSDLSAINAKDSRGRNIVFNIKMVVANPVQNLKPALAIRGMGCIQCHAKVESNIITDFGYGNNYFMTTNIDNSWWKSGGVYGDHAKSFTSMNLNSDIKVVVPKANLPKSIADDLHLQTLAAYIKERFSNSEYGRTKQVKVKEYSTVYIGAPTKNNILSAFSMESNDRSIYFKNSENSIALSGLTDKGTYFKNEGNLNCEGDLALRGPLYLNNLKVNSGSGCRIYVIGSVFIYGAISQINSSDNRNLQITSTTSISLGLGNVKKDGVFCEPNSRFATEEGYDSNSMRNRYRTFWTVPAFFTRAGLNPEDSGDAILAEAALIEAREGTLMDASCRDEGRNISFERLFLNAPAIHSRYQGDFIGTIIAEYAIMSLNVFKFEYDKVFDRVPLLPMLKSQVYLRVEE